MLRRYRLLDFTTDQQKLILVNVIEIEKKDAMKHQAKYRPQAGKPYPLGATLENGGVNFAFYSANATRVELHLYDTGDLHTGTVEVLERTRQIWHVFIPGLDALQRYS